MRFTTVATCLAAVLTPTYGLSVRNGQVPSHVLTDGDGAVDIPGDSPLKYCSADHGDDRITIKEIDLSPNPPLAGQSLQITAAGEVLEAIEEGAYVKLSVKYGLIKLLTLSVDFCEQVQNVDLSCPIEKGPLKIVKTVDLPKEIPPGTYTVVADVYTGNDDKITCLSAMVKFNMGGDKSFFNLEL